MAREPKDPKGRAELTGAAGIVGRNSRQQATMNENKPSWFLIGGISAVGMLIWYFAVPDAISGSPFLPFGVVALSVLCISIFKSQKPASNFPSLRHLALEKHTGKIAFVGILFIFLAVVWLVVGFAILSDIEGADWILLGPVITLLFAGILLLLFSVYIWFMKKLSL